MAGLRAALPVELHLDATARVGGQERALCSSLKQAAPMRCEPSSDLEQNRNTRNTGSGRYLGFTQLPQEHERARQQT